MDYEIINDITSADMAIRVRGCSIEELFSNAARAMMSEITEDISAILSDRLVHGEIRNNGLEMLYFEFLNEVLYLKDSQDLLLIPVKVIITYDSDTYLCSYTLSGEKIDKNRHKFRVDIKAVTLHGLTLYKHGGTFIAETVFDV